MRVTKTNPSRRTFIASGLASGCAFGILAAPAKSQNRSGDMEATIRADRNVATLVNVLNVEPENQQALVAALKESIERFFSKMPGCISSSILAGKDGRQVISYSQWKSAGDIEAFRQNPDFRQHIRRIAALSKAETITCDVVYVHAS